MPHDIRGRDDHSCPVVLRFCATQTVPSQEFLEGFNPPRWVGLRAVIRGYEDHGCPVSDLHTFTIEDGGMKHADYRHLVWKKRLDSLGLLNFGKSRE